MSSTLLAKYSTYEEELMGATTTMTAHAGGGQASATQITTKWNYFNTVVTALDSAKLPAGNIGKKCVVVNGSGTKMAIFPTTNDFINGVQNGQVILEGGNAAMVFECVNYIGGLGIWISYAIGSGTVFRDSISLSTANILALNSIQKQIVPAIPGVYFEIIGGSTKYTKGSVAFVFGGWPIVYIAGQSGNQYQSVCGSNFSTASFHTKNTLGNGDMIPNAAIMVKALTADYTTGNGSAIIYIEYIMHF